MILDQEEAWPDAGSWLGWRLRAPAMWPEWVLKRNPRWFQFPAPTMLALFQDAVFAQKKQTHERVCKLPCICFLGPAFVSPRGCPWGRVLCEMKMKREAARSSDCLAQIRAWWRIAQDGARENQYVRCAPGFQNYSLQRFPENQQGSEAQFQQSGVNNLTSSLGNNP